jgi:hypothetical protein
VLAGAVPVSHPILSHALDLGTGAFEALRGGSIPSWDTNSYLNGVNGLAFLALNQAVRVRILVGVLWQGTNPAF